MDTKPKKSTSTEASGIERVGEKEHGPLASQKSREGLASQKSHESLRPQVPIRDVHGWKWVIVVISLCSATFLWGLDGTITADIQVTFVREFGSIEKLAYASVAFFLGAAATVLTW